MSMEKFRTRIFATSNLTVQGVTDLNGTITLDGSGTISGVFTVTGRINASSGTVVLPVASGFVGSTNLSVNGAITVGGTQRLYWRQNGTTYFVSASGTIG